MMLKNPSEAKKPSISAQRQTSGAEDVIVIHTIGHRLDDVGVAGELRKPPREAFIGTRLAHDLPEVGLLPVGLAQVWIVRCGAIGLPLGRPV